MYTELCSQPSPREGNKEENYVEDAQNVYRALLTAISKGRK
jgi:hypothetical protein